MPNPNDPVLMSEKKALDQRIHDLEEAINADPDNEALEDQLADLEGQMKVLNDQLKLSRVASRDDHKPTGGGKASAPGQQKKS